MKKYFIYSIIILLCGCKSVEYTQVDRRFSNIYNPQINYLYPKYLVYHSSDELSTLIVKAYPDQFLFSMANPEQIYKAEFEVEFMLNELIDGEIMNEQADSGMYKFQILKQNENKYFHANIPIKVERGKQYVLTITMTDIVRETSAQHFIKVNKTIAWTHQDFLLTEVNNRFPEFPPLVIGKRGFKIRSIQLTDSIYFSFFNLENKHVDHLADTIPLPREDSLWKYAFQQNNVYKFLDHGIYYLQNDTLSNNGVALYNFGDNFPRIQSAENMIDPVSIFATDKEVNELKAAKNKKLAVDQFWLERADNSSRAREMIRIYYNRVFLSNIFFTSYQEGWRTDRGKVYVILGPPDAIARSYHQERWIYSKVNKNSPSIYVFDRQDHLFTDNHFKLNYSLSNTTGFKKILDSWRMGNVFMLNR